MCRRVPAFPDGPFAVVSLFVRLLIVGKLAALGFLERDGAGVGFTFVAQTACASWLNL